MDGTHDPVFKADGSIGSLPGGCWGLAPPVVVFKSMGDDVSSVCIDMIAHACKQGADTFSVKLVS